MTLFDGIGFVGRENIVGIAFVATQPVGRADPYVSEAVLGKGVDMEVWKVGTRCVDLPLAFCGGVSVRKCCQGQG